MAHVLSVERALRVVGADAQRGLSSVDAASQAGRFGPNMLAGGRAESGWHFADYVPVVSATVTAGARKAYRLGRFLT